MGQNNLYRIWNFRLTFQLHGRWLIDKTENRPRWSCSTPKIEKLKIHVCQSNGRTTFTIDVLALMKNVTGGGRVVTEFYFHKEWSKPQKPIHYCQNSPNCIGFVWASQAELFRRAFKLISSLIDRCQWKPTGNYSFLTGGRFLMFRRAWFRCVKTRFSAMFGSSSPEKGWTTSVAWLYTLVRKPYLWCIDHAQHFWYAAHDQRVTHSCLTWIALFSLSGSSCTIENIFLEILMLTKN